MSAAVKYMKDFTAEERFIFLHVEEWMEISETELGILGLVSFITHTYCAVTPNISKFYFFFISSAAVLVLNLVG